MPLGPWWTTAELRRVADSLRSGARPADVATGAGRSWNAVKYALTRGGHSVQRLLAEGRHARVQRILLDGGYTAEVMASEECTRHHAQHLITLVIGHGDRRSLSRTTSNDQARRIYLSVREVGFSETARRFNRPLMSVHKIAHRYRTEVLPESPPFQAVRTRWTGHQPRAATSGAGG